MNCSDLNVTAESLSNASHREEQSRTIDRLYQTIEEQRQRIGELQRENERLQDVIARCDREIAEQHEEILHLQRSMRGDERT